MWVMLLIPAVLSCLLLGAHFLRGGNMVLLAISVTAPLVLLIRRRWAVRAVQVMLVIAALEWVRTAIVLAEDRLATDAPWQRMVAILGGVAAWTVCSAWLLEMQPLRRRYRSDEAEDPHTQKTPDRL